MTDRELLTSVVGSHAHPGWFVAGIAAAERGELGPADLAEMLDDAVDLAIRDQEEAGIDVISDGEFGKGISWSQYALERLSGFERRPGIDIHARQDRGEDLRHADPEVQAELAEHVDRDDDRRHMEARIADARQDQRVGPGAERKRAAGHLVTEPSPRAPRARRDRRREVAGGLWTLVSPRAAFLYLAGWMVASVAALVLAAGRGLTASRDGV